MDDSAFGTRDSKGDWTPTRPLEPSPIWRYPPDFRRILAWLPGYFLPYNVLFMASALAYWRLVAPDAADLRVPSWRVGLTMLAVNAALYAGWCLLWEHPLYQRRRQSNRFKYNHQFPADSPSAAFWFRSQNVDNMLRSLIVGVPIWTFLQLVALWAFANSRIPWLGVADHPLWLGFLVLIVPVIHGFHFFCIHRLLHVPLLYRWVHRVHHRSYNPSPWSALSMHPVESLLYFGTVFWHFVIPSNPVIAIYQLQFAGFGAVPGHVGFDKFELDRERAFDVHAFEHYLHHKYFEVNYGGGGDLVPLDRLFGTYHDGSKQAEERMRKRILRKRERASR